MAGGGGLMSLKGKVILITGGTGSFGQKFTEIVLQRHDPEVIRIFSRGELLQQEMRQRFNNDSRLRFFIGDIRDKSRIERAMYGADIVVHAAALKQVPTCEYNPIEAVKTNIDGTINIIDAAIDAGIEKAIAISSDKAVHPVNLYGATKMVMERLFVQANVYSGKHKTRFSCTRYGNVIGSRGSVVPVFLEQKKQGSITITDERMTRFWLTLNQGVNFVIDCLDRMQGGEVFIPKIPSTRITDLAEAVAPGTKTIVTGIRPGEKLHEVLLTEDEARHARELDTYFIVEPEHPFWNGDGLKNSLSLPDGFTYTSDNNKQWLLGEVLKTTLEEAVDGAVSYSRR
jgi:UDP-N-acetylglucosamine 4,6-dehydratase/5-epimerase